MARFTTVVILLFILFAMIWIVCNSARWALTFLPTSGPLTRTPAQSDVDYVTYHILTEDGETLHCWYIRSDPGSPLCLYFHGNGGNLGNYVSTLLDLHKLGFSVLAIDYRGYGLSSGQPSERGILNDARATYTFATQKLGFSPRDILVYGFSMGTSPASYIASQNHDVMALVCHGGFTSLFDVPGKWTRLVSFTSETLFSPKGYLALIPDNVPIFIVHSKDDYVCPIDHGFSLLESVKHKHKKLIVLEGGHEQFVPNEEYIETLKALAKRDVKTALLNFKLTPKTSEFPSERKEVKSSSTAQTTSTTSASTTNLSNNFSN